MYDKPCITPATILERSLCTYPFIVGNDTPYKWGHTVKGISPVNLLACQCTKRPDLLPASSTAQVSSTIIVLNQVCRTFPRVSNMPYAISVRISGSLRSVTTPSAPNELEMSAARPLHGRGFRLVSVGGKLGRMPRTNKGEIYVSCT